MTRQTCLFTLLFPLLTFAASQGDHLIYHVDSGAGKSATKFTIHYFVGSEGVRSEMRTDNDTKTVSAVISSEKNKKLWLLVPESMIYVDLPTSAPPSGPEQTTPFHSTGKKRSLSGYTCNVLERKLPDRTEEACESKELKEVFGKIKKAAISDGFPTGLSSLPIEYIVKTSVPKGTPAVGDMTLRLVELKSESLDPKLFELPKDFTAKTLPKTK